MRLDSRPLRLLTSACAATLLTWLASCASEQPPAAPAADAKTDAAAGADGALGDAADASAGTDATSGGDAAGETAADAGPAKDAAPAKDAEPPIDVSAGPNDLLQNGEWFLGVQAAPFGNLKIPLRVSLVAEGDLAKGGTIVAFQVRAVSLDLTYVSDPVMTVKNIAVAAGGSFKINLKGFVLPAKASPTSSDVPIDLELIGKVTAKDSACGDVEGDVPQFSMALKGSKFKMVPLGKETTPFESSCEGNVAKTYSAIASCPALLPGANTVTSAERSRTFVVKPSAVTGKKLPLVLLFHGVGGEPEAMIKTSGLLAEQAKPESFVLIAPSSERDPKTGKAVLKSDWYYGSSLYDIDNPDLVFFDDLVKCATEKLDVDPKRVYVTGMSGGGLMSSFLALHRAKAIAAAAPFSGGYLHPWPKDSGKVPFVFSWGGPTDKAYEQNFDEMAKKVTKSLKDAGHFLIGCDHGLGHEWPKEGGAYAAKFLLAHTLGGTTPFTAPLGADWPSWCKVY